MCCSKSREKRVEGSWRGKAIIAFVGRRKYRLQKQQEEECWPFSHTPQLFCWIFSSSPHFRHMFATYLPCCRKGVSHCGKVSDGKSESPPLPHCFSVPNHLLLKLFSLRKQESCDTLKMNKVSTLHKLFWLIQMLRAGLHGAGLLRRRDGGKQTADQEAMKCWKYSMKSNYVK